MHIMSGEVLYYAFLSGVTEVRKQKNMLNKTNVFPVPDGDTGTNLVSTMNTIIEEMKIQISIKETVKSMANAALTGARGNSGIIFAQFINGISEEIRDIEILNIQNFAEIIKRAVPYTYRAISNPIEGTMITVIREWAEAVYKLKDDVKNFDEIITRTLEDAKRALANTSNLLEVLKKSSVVDSGANGFVIFLEGVASFLRYKNVIKLGQISLEESVEEELHSFTGDIPYRYCTEALISNDNMDSNELRKAIEHLGDSIIIAGNSEKIRVHIHTNKPDELFYILKEWGEILQQKVDDMVMQYDAVNNRLNKTAILTDSIADLPQELIDKYQIHMIPLNLIINGSSYLDKLTIKPDRFYSMLDSLADYPTSSQPAFKSLERVFSFLTSHYESIIAITVSKEMSGTFNVFKSAAERFIREGKKISIINSNLNSGAEGLLVLRAARELEKGKSYEEVVDIIKMSIKKTKIYVSVNTLKYMVRGGRVSPLKGIAGTLLNLKPIISIDEGGRGVASGKAFSTGQNIRKIIGIVRKAREEDKITSYCIVHANAEFRAQELGRKLTEVLGQEPEYITEISSVVGLNAGIGAIAVSYTGD